MRILLVEDDTALGDGLCRGFELEGHTVDWLIDGDAAAGALDADDFDVVILDLALPERSGLEVLCQWRSAGRDVPVLVLTAYEAPEDCVTALNRGADDYVVKPVGLEELAARLRALARRASGHCDNLLHCGTLALDRRTSAAWVGDEAVELSTYEFSVLTHLMERAERPVGRDALESRLYGWDGGPESNSLRVLIHNLRVKIGASRIRTVRGFGYRLVP